MVEGEEEMGQGQGQGRAGVEHETALGRRSAPLGAT